MPLLRSMCCRVVYIFVVLCVFPSVVPYVEFMYSSTHLISALNSRPSPRYSKCHVTSNKVTSKFECAEDKFQTRGWVPGREK
jgi:hypothetical protein